MKASKKWTTVTPFSKAMALAMLIIFPILGVFLGYYLRDNLLQTTPSEIKEVIKVPISDSEEEVIRRCGDFSREELGLNYGHYTMVHGPTWSPDCRHIAWSVFNSGTSYITPPGTESPSMKPYASDQPAEGVYLYDDRTKKASIVIVPLSPSLIPEFVGWKDSSVIVFTRNGKKNKEFFTYNLITKQTTSE